MLFRLSAAGLGCLLLVTTLAACGNSRSYPTASADASYNLGAMSLQEHDMPTGLQEQAVVHDYDNAAWAKIMGATDEAAEAKDLTDNVGRVRSYVSAFSAPEIQKIYEVIGISTLYNNVAKAQAQAAGYCGVPATDAAPDPSTRFSVPKMGDQATGFFVTEQRADASGNPQTFTDTTLCFRTGRILHAVQTTSVPGAEDIATTVRLAQAMLGHVNDTFDGIIPTPTPTSSVTPPASASAGASGTVPASGTATGSETAAAGTPVPGTPVPGTAPSGSTTPVPASPTP
ncbi:MAG: hypothetical protein ACRDG3_00465 [Tepidiformaceae bacterium]